MAKLDSLKQSSPVDITKAGERLAKLVDTGIDAHAMVYGALGLVENDLEMEWHLQRLLLVAAKTLDRTLGEIAEIADALRCGNNSAGAQ